MNITFWGVRGSASAPDADKISYGGNTSSIVLSTESMPNFFVLLDAGTGLTRFGATLNLKEDYQAVLLISHLHLYHIIGFQFTPLAFSKRCQTRIIGPSTRNIALESVFDHIMAPSYSPVYGRSYLLAEVEFQEVALEPMHFGDFMIRATPFPHTQDSYSWGYRVEDGGATVVYLTDARIRKANGDLLESAVALAEGADILIVGAFDPEHDRPQRTTYSDGIDLARTAHVNKLIFTHHHPEADDSLLDQVQADAQAACPDLQLTLGIEGVTLTL